VNPRALLAEFIGTFALVFIGVGSIAATSNSPNGSLLIPALAHGLVIVCFGTALGHISGGHFNPCVSVAMLVVGRIKAAAAGAYCVAQCLGALAGSFAIQFALGSSTMSLISHGIPALSKSTSVAQGMVIEAITTFFLVLVIFGTAVDRRAPKLGALLIGLTVTLDILFAGPVTGAAMNFARYIGPAIVSGNFTEIGTYVVGPFVGAILAALTYDKFLAPNSDLESA
jgi:MIP family channel proteins